MKSLVEYGSSSSSSEEDEQSSSKRTKLNDYSAIGISDSTEYDEKRAKEESDLVDEEERKNLLASSLLVAKHDTDATDDDGDLFSINEIVASHKRYQTAVYDDDDDEDEAEEQVRLENNGHLFDESHPSSQYAIRYDSQGHVQTTQTLATIDFADSFQGHEQQQTRLISRAEMRFNAPVEVTNVTQRDILESSSASDLAPGAGDGMRKLTNRDFASRRNHLTGLLSIAKQRESAFTEHHQKAKKTKRDAAARYGW